MKANYFVKKQKREIIYIYIHSTYIYTQYTYIYIYTESFQNTNIAIHGKSEALNEEN